MLMPWTYANLLNIPYPCVYHIDYYLNGRRFSGFLGNTNHYKHKHKYTWATFLQTGEVCFGLCRDLANRTASRLVQITVCKHIHFKLQCLISWFITNTTAVL